MRTIVCIAIFACSCHAEPVLYLIDHATNVLHRVNVETSVRCPVGLIGEGDRDLASMTMLDAWRGVTVDRVADEIITFDVRTAEILTIAPLDQDYITPFRGLALSPDGVLYGLLPGDQLRTIDPATGDTTFVAGLSGVTRMEAIEFLEDGTLIGAGRVNGIQSKSFFEIDMATGKTSEFVTFNVIDIDVLARGTDNRMYFANAVNNGAFEPIWRWDPKTGVFDAVSQDGLESINGLAASRQTCRVDLNADGELNVLDFVSLQLAFQAGSCEADVSGDGVLSILDFVAFQFLFGEGCDG